MLTFLPVLLKHILQFHCYTSHVLGLSYRAGIVQRNSPLFTLSFFFLTPHPITTSSSSCCHHLSSHPDYTSYCDDPVCLSPGKPTTKPQPDTTACTECAARLRARCPVLHCECDVLKDKWTLSRAVMIIMWCETDDVVKVYKITIMWTIPWQSWDGNRFKTTAIHFGPAQPNRLIWFEFTTICSTILYILQKRWLIF